MNKSKNKASIQTSTTLIQPIFKSKDKNTLTKKPKTNKSTLQANTNTAAIPYKTAHYHNSHNPTKISSTTLASSLHSTRKNDNFIIIPIYFQMLKVLSLHIYFINKCKFKKWKFFNLSINKGTIHSTQIKFNHWILPESPPAARKDHLSIHWATTHTASSRLPSPHHHCYPGIRSRETYQDSSGWAQKSQNFYCATDLSYHGETFEPQQGHQ